MRYNLIFIGFKIGTNPFVDLVSDVLMASSVHIRVDKILISSSVASSFIFPMIFLKRLTDMNLPFLMRLAFF